MICVYLELVEARSLEHEDTKKRESREARRPRSDRTSALATFVLRAFVDLRAFVVQTSPTSINQFQTHPFDLFLLNSLSKITHYDE